MRVSRKEPALQHDPILPRHEAKTPTFSSPGAADQYHLQPQGGGPDLQRALAALHANAERLLEQGPIDEKGARALVKLALASGLTSSTMELMASLAEQGDDAGRKIIGQFNSETARHIRARAKGCSLVDLRAAQDLRTLAMRDGRLDAEEIRALAELGLTHEFSAAGRKVLDEVLTHAPIGSLPGAAKRRLIEKALKTWRTERGEPFSVSAEDIRRIGWVLDVGGFRSGDRKHIARTAGLEPLTTEAKQALDTLLARPAIGDRAEWTILVYMNADSNAETTGAINLNQMERIGQKPGIFNVLTFVDAGGRHAGETPAGWKEGSRLLWISKDEGNRISSREIAIDPGSDLAELLARYRGRVNMGNPHVLKATVDLVRKIAPSDHLMVNLLGHGHSWMGHRGLDRAPRSGEYIGNVLNPSGGDLETAFKGLNVDVLSCNSCLMASQEIAKTAKRAGIKYLAASESLVPMTGFRYDALLDGVSEIFQRTGSVTPENMAKWVTDCYADGEPTGELGHEAYSVIDLQKSPKLHRQLEKFAKSLIAAGGLDRNEGIRLAYLESPAFYNEQIDLGVFARNVAKRCDGFVRKHALEMLREIKRTCYSRTNSPPSLDQNGKPIPRTRKLDREGKTLRNQWDLPKSQLPTGISIFAPTDSIGRTYRTPSSAWADSAWIRLLKGIERRPRTEEEQKLIRELGEAQKKQRQERARTAEPQTTPAGPSSAAT